MDAWVKAASAAAKEESIRYGRVRIKSRKSRGGRGKLSINNRVHFAVNSSEMSRDF
jgi:hypothetical protein